MTQFKQHLHIAPSTIMLNKVMKMKNPLKIGHFCKQSVICKMKKTVNIVTKRGLKNVKPNVTPNVQLDIADLINRGLHY